MRQPKTSNPFVNLVLDEEETLLEAALAKGELEEDPQFEATKAMLKEAATR